MLYIINDKNIETKKEYLKNKSVLIFDDSIKDGNTAKNLIDIVQSIGPKSITVAAVVCAKESLTKLRSDYPNVEFYAGKEILRGDFIKIYRNMCHPMIEDICLPTQKEHPFLIVRYLGGKSDDFFALLEDFGELGSSESEYIDYGNRCKKYLILDESHKRRLNDILSEKKSMDKCIELEDMMKIRIYLIDGEIGRIILQPIVIRDFPDIYSRDQIESIIKVYNSYILHDFLLKDIFSNEDVYKILNILSVSIFWDKNEWWDYL